MHLPTGGLRHSLDGQGLLSKPQQEANYLILFKFLHNSLTPLLSGRIEHITLYSFFVTATSSFSFRFKKHFFSS